MRTIEWVADALNAPIHRPDRSRPLTGVAVDSRSVEPGQLFVALPGERTDGHRFLTDALQNGASGALVREVPSDAQADAFNCIEVSDPLRALQQLAAHRRAALTIPIVGITGSAGKTTTKELLHHVLSERYRSHRSPGNYNTEIGLPLALLNMPDDAEVGILEMGLQHPGDIATLCEIARPTFGVLTSIGDAHIGFFPDQATLARQKWDLIEALPDDGQAVINLDAPFVAEWREALACDSITFGIERTDADVSVVDVDDAELDGLKIVVELPDETVQLKSSLLGRPNAYAVLAALAVGRALRVPLEGIQRAVAAFAPVPHRMELKRSQRYGLVLDDTYNASPAAMQAALRTLARLQTDRRKIAVLGDMRELGAQSERRHREIADVIKNFDLDLVVTVGNHAQIVSETLQERHRWSPKRAVHTTDEDDLLDALNRGLRDDDNLVLVKGSRAMALDRLVDRMVTPSEATRR